MQLNKTQFQKRYQQSLENPQQFWAEQAKQFLTWLKPWQEVVSGDFNHLPVRWFTGAELNACHNCLDRHLDTRGEQTALIYETETPGPAQNYTYRELHQAVMRAAAALKQLGINQGDRVVLYMPMIPEVIICMLACARIGAVHSVVFAGYSAQALQQRLIDTQAKAVITADGLIRNGKFTPIKDYVDQACNGLAFIQHIIVVQHTYAECQWQAETHHWYHELIEAAPEQCPYQAMQANDPLFILYTSGSTGKPKGIQHSTGGYLLYAAQTFAYLFDYQPGEVFWCTADMGWITGHTYGVYGPLANGATIVLYDGVPTYPDPSRYWRIIDKHRVNIFYTAPTALRALMREGDYWLGSSERDSLRILGSVGEPINPEVWQWYDQAVGKSRCYIVDTWWQTETGASCISPIPHVTTPIPGVQGQPFFGINPKLVTDQEQTQLVLTQPWPGLMQTVYGDDERFRQYFTTIPGCYVTGDGASVDAEGNYRITGRIDDVLNVSGHRMSTAEIESAIVATPDVAEAAVVGMPHPIKGEGIYAFVTLKTDVEPSEQIKQAIKAEVRKQLGPVATPDQIQWAPQLPKTRSGKIMRRLLRKIVHHETENLGDTSALADAEVIKDLIKGCKM